MPEKGLAAYKYWKLRGVYFIDSEGSIGRHLAEILLHMAKRGVRGSMGAL